MTTRDIWNQLGDSLTQDEVLLDQKDQEIARLRANLLIAADDAAKAAATDTAEDAAYEKTIADLKAQIRALQPKTKTKWGANYGGYSQSGESNQAAFARIQQGFGKISIVRYWGNDFTPFPLPAWLVGVNVFADLGSDVNGVNAGEYDKAFDAAVISARPDDMFTMGHEPEDDVFQKHGFTLADWQKAQVRLGRRCAAIRDDVMYGPLLMGSSYHPTRYKSATAGNVPASQWLDFDLSSVQFIAGDFYQRAQDDASADTPEVLMGGFIDLLKKTGKPGVIGELGARRVNPPYSPGISDAARAKFLPATKAYLDSVEPDILAVMYYESDRGTADKVPWMLLNNAAGTGVKSPLAAAAYRNICMSQ